MKFQTAVIRMLLTCCLLGSACPLPAIAEEACGSAVPPFVSAIHQTFSPDLPGAPAAAQQAVAALAADFPVSHSFPLAWGRQVVMEQRHGGLPVLGGRVAVTYDAADFPFAIRGRRLTVAGSVPTVATVAENQAVETVSAWLQTHAAPSGQVFAPSRPAAVELAVQVDSQGLAHLVYRIVQPTWDVAGMGGTYEALVDAVSGGLLQQPRDVNRYHASREANTLISLSLRERVGVRETGHGASASLVRGGTSSMTGYDQAPQGPLGTVYKAGNPVAGLRRPRLQDGDRVPDRAYRTVVLEHLNTPGELIGSFVDTVSLTLPAFRAAPVDGDFRFRRDPGDPAAGAGFDAVMAYYYIDQAQQYLQRNGAGAPLQRIARVNVNGSDGLHPYYVPGEDFIMLSSGGVDAGEDAEAILHEYFHAVQEWAKPGAWDGPSNPGVCAGTRALAEGYSDFFAARLTAQRPPYRNLVAEWMATTTDLQRRDLRTLFAYPQEAGADEYRNGSLWAGALLEASTRNGPAMDPLWLDALTLTEPGFTFTDAAAAVLTAAARRNLPPKYQPSLLRAFARRGLIGSDLDVRLTAPAEPAKVGPEFSHPITVTVANRGPETAPAVELQGQIGRPARLLAVPDNCRAEGNAFTYDLTDLAAGSERSLQLSVTGTRPGSARITADASLKTYGSLWVTPDHLALLDPAPANSQARIGLPLVDWCADISGSWNVSTALRLRCAIPEGVVLDEPIDDSGEIDIVQNGCRFQWNAGAGLRRRGHMHRNHFAVGGIVAKILFSNASIQFYNNHISIHGTYAGDSIDDLRARATVNGRGCIGGQCRDFSCSTPGGIHLSFTRVPDSGS